MATIATLVVKILGDPSGYNKAAAGVATSAKKLGQSATRAGIGLTAGLTLPIVGIGVAAVKLSSDLEESVNAVNVVFGEAGEVILQYGETAAQTVGLTNSKFNSLATVTGAFLQNVGFDARGAADETINLAERAADMASVFNTDVDTALNAIQSGLKGEFNPLEQFGVKINAAAIEAKAFALGLADAEGNLDDNAKATAALGLIYGQTEKLAGDFANTSDSLANSTKIAKAELGDAAAEMGNMLIPIALQLVGVIRQVVAWFTSLTPQTRQVILVVLGVVAAIGPLLLIFGALASAIGAIIPIVTAVIGVLSGPVIAVVAVVIGAIALLVAAWKNDFGGMRTALIKFWEGKVKPVLAAVIQFLSVFIPAAIRTVVGFWQNSLLPAFQALWAFVDKNVLPILDTLVKIVGTVLKLAFETLVGVWANFVKPALTALWRFVTDKVGPILMWLKNKVIDPLAKTIREGLASALQWVTDKLKAFSDWLSSIQIPDWLIPGSPTPLELGLVGIGKQMAKLNRMNMPAFEAGFGLPSPGELNASAMAAGMNMSAVGNITPRPTIVVPVNYAPMFPRDDEETQARILGPAIERVLHRVGESE